jgi:chromosome segregation ATPase
MTEYAEQLEQEPALASHEGGDLLDVLEQRLEHLVRRHRVALSECDDQLRQLADRDAVIGRLNARIASLEKLRSEVLGRVERLIEEVDRLERELASGAGE